ncbi:nucleotide sugar dehydrogenase [Synechococcus sp. CBW1004]|uniref:nucleotide sugar dehydrogenase n=1 Tax=Synechococcus sp. CBW1004 TaxID=1353136 RepID=UPI0018CEDFED|nr:nucleotide sugar dehydrogenase [Synechococcus sp. CBW1004]QPN62472.1 nucleotide sugar dehydrogenase [Synechococcus sp. CBW1004]
MEISSALLQRLRSKEARIAVVGLGYVGLPLALSFTESGYSVLGLDIDASKVEALQQGRSYLHHIDDQRVANARSAGLLEATLDVRLAATADALILCVPTPLTRFREPDLSSIHATLEALAIHLRPGQVISLESTTYPGTTEEVLRPRIEARGLKVGEDVFLVYSPEREDPGNASFSTATIPKLIAGSTTTCLEVGLTLYEHVIRDLVPVSSTRSAEFTKLVENIQRAVNIGLMNELKLLADRMNIDLHEVIRAAATKPFGFAPYYPGPGIGGHCVPIDPYFLAWKARELGMHTRFIELAGEINAAMPGHVVRTINDALNQSEKALRGSRILLLGIAYKKNIEDIRESPALEIMEQLQSKGAIVHYSDPYVPIFPPIEKHSFNLRSLPLSAESIAGFDAVVLCTDHDSFDYELILNAAALLIDSRGRYTSEPGVIRA